MSFLNPVIAALVLYIVVGIGGSLFLVFSSNAALKRRIAPVQVWAGAITFIALVIALGAGTLQILFIGAMAVAIAILTFRNMRVCGRCARVSWGGHDMRPAQYCTRCGAPLGEGPAGDDPVS